MWWMCVFAGIPAVLNVDKAHFQECLLETLQEMFGSQCTDKLFQRDRLLVLIDDKQAVINLDSLVRGFAVVVFNKYERCGFVMVRVEPLGRPVCLLGKTLIVTVAGELCKLAQVTGPEFPHPFSPVRCCLPATGWCRAVWNKKQCLPGFCTMCWKVLVNPYPSSLHAEKCVTLPLVRGLGAEKC